MSHPEHVTFTEAAPGHWVPAKPLHPSGLLGWRTRRACRKRGGHWWHPLDGMIAWYCCQCGHERDGMPSDGEDARHVG